MFIDAHRILVQSNIIEFTQFVVTFSVLLSFFKINERSSIYIKTQFLLLLLIALALPLLRSNVGGILPIFLMLEFGTILFILVTLKGSNGSFLHRHSNFFVIAPFTTLPIFFIFKLVVVFVCNSYLWVDLFIKPTSNSEFSFWSASLLHTNCNTTLIVCGLILVITCAVMYIKVSLPSHRCRDGFFTLTYSTLTYLLQSSYFFKKQLVSFFKPN